MSHSSVNTLDIKEARKLILLSQGFKINDKNLSRKNAVSNIIQRLKYIQIDSIAVVERAHHHSLWNRVSNYQSLYLDQLLDDKQVFEYWSHAASYLPMTDYRYSLPRKKAISSGQQHWFKKDKKIMKYVMDRIEEEGPLQASDFKDQRNTTNGWWDWKPAKKALEQLFMEGELMVVRRNKFHKVYDLTERVVPNHIDTSLPTSKEYYYHLIVSYLSANSIGTAEQISYLLKGLKPHILKVCNQMLADGELVTIKVKDITYFALPEVTSLLESESIKKELKVLSPFDNLLIQRNRTTELFDFDYKIECYVPEKKRQYGYFSLPLLWGDEFVGCMDAKMDRKNSQLLILNLHLETKITDKLTFDLKDMLSQFMQFNQATSLSVKKITTLPNLNFNKQLNMTLKDLTKHFKQDY